MHCTRFMPVVDPRLIMLLAAALALGGCAGYSMGNAIVWNDPEGVTRLIESGEADADDMFLGMTALASAAGGGRVEIARVLLDRGADPDLYSTTIAAPPIVIALSSVIADRCVSYYAGKAEHPQRADRIVQLLAARGADVDASVREAYSVGPLQCRTKIAQRTTALMLAVHEGRSAAVRALVDAGADPTHANAEGMTALHYAVLSPDDGVRRLLLSTLSPELDVPPADGSARGLFSTAVLLAMQGDAAARRGDHEAAAERYERAKGRFERVPALAAADRTDQQLTAFALTALSLALASADAHMQAERIGVGTSFWYPARTDDGKVAFTSLGEAARDLARVSGALAECHARAQKDGRGFEECVAAARAAIAPPE